ncbi:MAG: hypothetical protein NZM06_07520 [Chloroherpetonaceae bacterium]|nr:hypothetical protein [Chloroherpetonaceae bacterium]MDW8437572.1 hypothetical protein [Chloroherpetonaceae bacterium]
MKTDKLVYLIFKRLPQGFFSLIGKGRAEGIEKGRIEGKLETVPLLRDLGLTDEAIAQKLNLPIELVRKA